MAVREVMAGSTDLGIRARTAITSLFLPSLKTDFFWRDPQAIFESELGSDRHWITV